MRGAALLARRVALASTLGGVAASLLHRPTFCQDVTIESLSARVSLLVMTGTRTHAPCCCRAFPAAAAELDDGGTRVRLSFWQESLARVAAPAMAADHSATIIDGKAVAKQIRIEVREGVEDLKGKHGVVPGLAVVLVGNRTDSATYVRMKKRAATEVGFYSIDRQFDESVTQQQLLDTVRELNADPQVHAILVQLPLPRHVDEAAVLEAIDVKKDVDGFSASNIGNMCLRGGRPPLAVPCTPAGCVELLQRSEVDVSGKEVVVVGRSNIVGMPVAHLLMSMDATVTTCHSRTKDLPGHVRSPPPPPPPARPADAPAAHTLPSPACLLLLLRRRRRLPWFPWPRPLPLQPGSSDAAEVALCRAPSPPPRRVHAHAYGIARAGTTRGHRHRGGWLRGDDPWLVAQARGDGHRRRRQLEALVD